MPDYLRCDDARGRSIGVSHQTWFDKILVDHADLDGMEDAVIDTLEDPDERRRDQNFLDREVFYKDGLFPPPYDDQLMKVVVAFRQDGDGTWSGRIVTAYPVDRIPRGEKRLWTR